MKKGGASERLCGGWGALVGRRAASSARGNERWLGRMYYKVRLGRGRSLPLLLSRSSLASYLTIPTACL